MAPDGADFENVQAGNQRRYIQALCFLWYKILRLKEDLPVDSEELKVQWPSRWALNV